MNKFLGVSSFHRRLSAAFRLIRPQGDSPLQDAAAGMNGEYVRITLCLHVINCPPLSLRNPEGSPSSVCSLGSSPFHILATLSTHRGNPQVTTSAILVVRQISKTSSPATGTSMSRPPTRLLPHHNSTLLAVALNNRIRAPVPPTSREAGNTPSALFYIFLAHRPPVPSL